MGFDISAAQSCISLYALYFNLNIIPKTNLLGVSWAVDTPNCLPSKKATQKRLLNKGYLKKATQKRLLKKGYINKKGYLMK